MAVPESKRLLIVRSHFQSHPSAGPALRATEPLSPYRRVRGPLTPTISAPDFSSLPLNSSGHDFGGRWGGGCIRAVVNLCFTPAAQCGGGHSSGSSEFNLLQVFWCLYQACSALYTRQEPLAQHWKLSRGLWEEGGILNWILDYHKHCSQFYLSLWSSEEL